MLRTVRALYSLYVLASVQSFTHYRSTTGIHPELIHLDKELSERRDKCLKLASKRRTYEVGDATKWKRAAKNVVWSWWKVQVEMLSETNRKRRRLERERRGLERPQPSMSFQLSHSFCDLSWNFTPVRRVPHIPPELPPPITLRDLTWNVAYEYAPGHMLGTTGAYPSLTMIPDRRRR